MLSLLVMFVALPKGRRLVVLALLALTMAAVGYKLSQRIDDNRPLMTKLLQGDERRQFLFDPRYDRYYELELAWKTIKKNPLLGVGPAGSFETPGPMGLEYHRGNYTFVHSGIGHILLKTGLVGLLAFLGLLGVYIKLLVAEWRRADHKHRGALVFSATGMIAFIPTLLLGTPLIELRTALTMGLLMALPLVLRRLRTATVAEPPPKLTPAMRMRPAR
jgi:O-antigen ligase